MLALFPVGRAVRSDTELGRCLRSHWGLADARVEVLGGGMGSATWLVDSGHRRWVAKVVAPALRRPLAGGMAVARLLECAGIPAGAPLPSTDGSWW